MLVTCSATEPKPQPLLEPPTVRSWADQEVVLSKEAEEEIRYSEDFIHNVSACFSC